MQTMKSRIREHEHTEFCAQVAIKRYDSHVDKPWGLFATFCGGLRRWDPECPPAPIDWDHHDWSGNAPSCKCVGAQARYAARKK